MKTILHRLPSLLILTLLLSIPAAACLNEYGTGIGGDEVLTMNPLDEVIDDYMKELRNDRTTRETLVADSATRARELKADHGYIKRNDYAVSLIRLGHVDEAIAILRGIEHERPGIYQTASNIGTAYELAGKIDSALYWIGEGLRRNPDSHFGSEWIHIRILKAKQALARDPDWLKTHTVLGLDFGSKPLPATPKGADSLDVLARSLLYQLSERLRLVEPPDPIVADLLVDLGNTVALTSALQIATEVYDLALEYEPVHADRVRARLDAIEDVIRTHPAHSDSAAYRWVKNHPMLVLLVGVVVCVLVLWGLLTVVMRWRARS